MIRYHKKCDNHQRRRLNALVIGSLSIVYLERKFEENIDTCKRSDKSNIFLDKVKRGCIKLVLQ